MKALRLAPLVLFPLLLAGQQADLLNSLKFRQIGPFRGGRSVAVAGVPSQPDTYYFGAVGGGVFKTTDSGLTWLPVSDGQFKTGSVGALAVADSDPNVIYAGMGEACVRGNATHGDGVYKSVDAGRTWRNIGLEDSYHIGAVRVHPKNPDIVYVAALGHLWGPNEMRGVYRTTDGGATWKQVLKRSNTAGAVDIAMDPNNPRVLYAAMWEISRKPWRMDSGGPGSGLFKSTDGGDTWTEISHAPGLPSGVLGRIGVTISPVNPERVWALVEAVDGGLFRTDNGGRNWTKVNDQNTLKQRAWYYAHVFADTKNADTVYALNVGIHRSIDGGRTFSDLRPPHGDNHGLWIAPDDPNRMIESNDGGATITRDGGRTWSTLDNQPTAQFYRVALDQDFPYNIYGAQQDNTTVRIAQPHRRRHHHGGGLVRRGRRRERLDCARSAQFADCVRRLLRRPAHTPGQAHRAEPQHQCVAGQHDGLRRGGHEVPLPVELPDRIFAARPQDAVHRFQRADEDHQRRTELGGDQPRPDAQRQIQNGHVGWAHHAGQHQRGVLLHGVHDHRIAGEQGRDLDGVGRRPGACDARRRQEVGQRYASRHARVDPHQLDRCLAARCGHGVRGSHELPDGRFPSVPVQDHGLRQDVEENRQRDSEQRVHPRGARRSESQGPAGGGDGDRSVPFVR